MKKILSAVLVFCLLLAGCSSATEPAEVSSSPTAEPTESGNYIYTPGTYTASAAGMGGDVTVEMTFDASSITAVFGHITKSKLKNCAISTFFSRGIIFT